MPLEIRSNLHFLAITGAALLICVPAFGAGLECNALLDHGLRNISVSQGAEAAVQFKFEKNCRKDFQKMSDSQLAEAEAEIFGTGSGSASYGRQKQEERLSDWCKQNEQYSHYSSSTYQKSETIYKDAILAWSNCTKLEGKDVRADIQILNQSKRVEITLSAFTGTKTGILLKGISADGFSCAANGPSLKSEKGTQQYSDDDFKNSDIEIKNLAISIECVRNRARTEVSKGQTYSVLNSGSIVVRTSTFPVTVDFVEEWAPPLPDSRAAAIENSLASFRGAVVGFTSSDCPQGWERLEKASGRMLLGAETGKYIVNETHGQSTVTLQVPNLPTHRHDTGVGASKGDTAMEIVQDKPKEAILGAAHAPHSTMWTGNTGSAVPFNIMNPYYVVTFCKRI